MSIHKDYASVPTRYPTIGDFLKTYDDNSSEEFGKSRVMNPDILKERNTKKEFYFKSSNRRSKLKSPGSMNNGNFSAKPLTEKKLLTNSNTNPQINASTSRITSDDYSRKENSMPCDHARIVANNRTESYKECIESMGTRNIPCQSTPKKHAKVSCVSEKQKQMEVLNMFSTNSLKSSKEIATEMNSKRPVHLNGSRNEFSILLHLQAEFRRPLTLMDLVTYFKNETLGVTAKDEISSLQKNSFLENRSFPTIKKPEVDCIGMLNSHSKISEEKRLKAMYIRQRNRIRMNYGNNIKTTYGQNNVLEEWGKLCVEELDPTLKDNRKTKVFRPITLLDLIKHFENEQKEHFQTSSVLNYTTSNSQEYLKSESFRCVTSPDLKQLVNEQTLEFRERKASYDRERTFEPQPSNLNNQPNLGRNSNISVKSHSSMFWNETLNPASCGNEKFSEIYASQNSQLQIDRSKNVGFAEEVCFLKHYTNNFISPEIAKRSADTSKNIPNDKPPPNISAIHRIKGEKSEELTYKYRLTSFDFAKTSESEAYAAASKCVTIADLISQFKNDHMTKHKLEHLVNESSKISKDKISNINLSKLANLKAESAIFSQENYPRNDESDYEMIMHDLEFFETENCSDRFLKCSCSFCTSVPPIEYPTVEELVKIYGDDTGCIPSDFCLRFGHSNEFCYYGQYCASRNKLN